MNLSHAWSVAFRSFDDNPMLSGLMDTQMVYAIACVGSKRTAYWDGSDWTYTEWKAKLYQSKPEATSVMLDMGSLSKYCRLVAQPHASMHPLSPMWPTVNGWHIDPH